MNPRWHVPFLHVVVSFGRPAWLQIFRNGNLDKPGDYGGPRDASGIVSYLEKVSGPPSKELKTKEEVQKYLL